jgi:hypothetical protein
MNIKKKKNPQCKQQIHAFAICGQLLCDFLFGVSLEYPLGRQMPRVKDPVNNFLCIDSVFLTSVP